MNKDRQIEEMARMDGWIEESNPMSGRRWWTKGEISIDIPVNYHEDHNAVQRVVDELDTSMLKQVGYELENICGTHLHPWVVLLKATCEQKIEALLKAHGKWE